MLVREHMTPCSITIDPETSIQDAIHCMRQNWVRCLPVVDEEGRLVGIISEKELLYAFPSPHTSPNVCGISYLLPMLKVKNVMTRNVITVKDDCALEEAAHMMVEHKMGSLPVVRDGEIVGIVTEIDLFKVLLIIMRARKQDVRSNLPMRNQTGISASMPT